ncbi:hypothetical protein C448_09587 [Halococcus morrhuae DSM 1307]|uniref:Uncharacterized protein n=1 Tax=Halococcus morrhuae DSM 1307 TaxID=931277 RepID=M0MGX4_HALMO|nr:hypothetical protein C448_09587 [Halococcus morrhuae DSM 1307]
MTVAKFNIQWERKTRLTIHGNRGLSSVIWPTGLPAIIIQQQALTSLTNTESMRLSSRLALRHSRISLSHFRERHSIHPMMLVKLSSVWLMREQLGGRATLTELRL